MQEVMIKTMELIDVLEESKIVKNLVKAKELCLNDPSILASIRDSKNLSDNELIVLRKKIYQNDNYKLYQDSYNELFLIVQRINYLFKQITMETSCSNK